LVDDRRVGRRCDHRRDGRSVVSRDFVSALQQPVVILPRQHASNWLAASSKNKPVHIPSIAQIKSASGEQLDHLRRTMSGNYGYSMGYQNEDRYQPLANRGLSETVLVADMPSLNRPGRNSINHGAWGQNCLFGDGHVQFIRGDSVGEDAIFENDYGVVAPGTSEHDSVIAPSHLSPVKW
jgi:prepilin-type processing-associated H-X9-DG protein